MTFAEVLKFYGRQIDLARALKTTRGVVHQWKKRNLIPRGRQFEIELLTNGKLKAARKK